MTYRSTLLLLALAAGIAATPVHAETHATVIPGFSNPESVLLDGDRRPVHGISKDEVRVLEDGASQELLRFEEARDLPLSALMVLDTSTSMAERLDQVRIAIRGEQEIAREGVKARDRSLCMT